MRKVFLEDLPRKNGGRSSAIDWNNSAGYTVKFIYDNIEGELEIIKYSTIEQRLYVKYNENISDITRVGMINAGLRKVLGLMTFEYKFSIGEIIKNNKSDLTILNHIRKGNGKKSKRHYEYRCNICLYTGNVDETILIRGFRCPCCSNKTVVEGVNDIPTTAPWMVEYFQGGYDEAKLYTRGSNKKIYPICPDCGTIKGESVIIASIYRYKGISCTCKDGISYPNKLMYNILKSLNIDFRTEKEFEWLNNRKYDFYIPSKDVIIEMHGIQHYERTFERMGKRARTLEEEQFNDKYKKEAALNNGISHYVVIDCRKPNLEWLKENILNSILAELIDFNSVDWNMCEKKSLQSLIKEVCNYKKNNPDETSISVANKFGISRGTAINYMKKGTNLGWCEYDPRLETSNASRKLGKTGRKVEIFKDGESQGVFNSMNDLVRASKELFGVELERRNIGNVCRGVQKTHKGYTFKYID